MHSIQSNAVIRTDKTLKKNFFLKNRQPTSIFAYILLNQCLLSSTVVGKGSEEIIHKVYTAGP